MTENRRIEINGQSYSALPGEAQLYAALVNGLDKPIDCRSGNSGTCPDNLTNGREAGSAKPGAGTLHASLAHIASDARVRTGTHPSEPAARGSVEEINQLCSGAFEVVLVLDRPSTHRPGQYYNVQFDGFPARAFSPTPALDYADPPDQQLLRFHVKRIAGGAVSSHLETETRKGHGARLFGPFGTACFEPGRTERLILVSGGTGFAPIWSIADAALTENSDRALVLVAGASRVSEIYMNAALRTASFCPNVTVIAITGEKVVERNWLRCGNLFDHLPDIYPDDIIHAAGPPALVEALSKVAETFGCRMHADPFTATGAGAQQGETPVARPDFGARRKPPDSKVIPFPRRTTE